ncbi:hypothetical protein ACFLXK_02090 [Chloroflexota bacterium]
MLKYKWIILYFASSCLVIAWVFFLREPGLSVGGIISQVLFRLLVLGVFFFIPVFVINLKLPSLESREDPTERFKFIVILATIICAVLVQVFWGLFLVLYGE